MLGKPALSRLFEVPAALPQTRRPPALLLLVWLLSALLAAGPSLAAAHFALVRHRLCLEHGQLEHVTASEPSYDNAAPEPSQGPLVREGGSDIDAHGHLHDACTVSAPGGLAALLPALGLRQFLSADFRAPAPERAQAAHVGIALLEYAPKLEPPSAMPYRFPLEA